MSYILICRFLISIFKPKLTFRVHFFSLPLGNTSYSLGTNTACIVLEKIRLRVSAYICSDARSLPNSSTIETHQRKGTYKVPRSKLRNYAINV